MQEIISLAVTTICINDNRSDLQMLMVALMVVDRFPKLLPLARLHAQPTIMLIYQLYGIQI